nr:RNA-directed DNA polymerase, eukaryota, reverse transcriptase zinc-binding domain protein [Tanacetum cinerariifolium]
HDTTGCAALSIGEGTIFAEIGASSGNWQGINEKIGIINIYAPQGSRQKRVLWQNLFNTMGAYDIIWILLEILMWSGGLQDFAMGGRRFTRYNRQEALWGNMMYTGSADIVLKKKLKNLRKDEPKEIHEASGIHFASRFKELNSNRPLFRSNLFMRLDDSGVSFLESEFTLEEVKETVWDCSSSKSSSLKINLAKCQLFGIGVPLVDVESIARSINCSYSSLPFTYLSLPMGKDMRKIKAWDEVVNRFSNRLSMWKAKLLSVRDRLTLVNAAKKKMSWVSWNKVALDKEDGDLRIGSLKAKNMRLLAKWKWRFFNDTNALWCKAWRRQPIRRSLCDIFSILNLMNGLVFDTSKEDEWVWNIESSGNFSVSSLSSLKQKKMLVTFVDSPKFVWNSWVPRKVNLCAWRVAMDRLPTRENLLCRDLST